MLDNIDEILDNLIQLKEKIEEYNETLKAKDDEIERVGIANKQLNDSIYKLNTVIDLMAKDIQTVFRTNDSINDIILVYMDKASEKTALKL